MLWIYLKQLAFKQNILDEMQVHKKTTGISFIKHGNIIFIMLNQTNRRTLHIMTFENHNKRLNADGLLWRQKRQGRRQRVLVLNADDKV